MKKKLTVFKNKLFNLESEKGNREYEILMTRAIQENPTIDVIAEEKTIKSLKMSDEEGIETTIQQIWMMVSYRESIELDVKTKPLKGPVF